MRVFVHPGVDYYAMLGVKPDAGVDELRRAYRRKAWEMHPDRQAPELRAQAEHWTMILNSVFDTLRDPRRRAAYDTRRATPAWPRPTSTPQTHTPPRRPSASPPPAWATSPLWVEDLPDLPAQPPVLSFISDPALTAVLFSVSAVLLVLRAIL